MSQIILLTKEQQSLVETNSTCIEGKYYFIPYWFEKMEDNLPGSFKIHSLERIPENLRKLIEECK